MFPDPASVGAVASAADAHIAGQAGEHHQGAGGLFPVAVALRAEAGLDAGGFGRRVFPGQGPDAARLDPGDCFRRRRVY